MQNRKRFVLPFNLMIVLMSMLMSHTSLQFLVVSFVLAWVHACFVSMFLYFRRNICRFIYRVHKEVIEL